MVGAARVSGTGCDAAAARGVCERTGAADGEQWRSAAAAAGGDDGLDSGRLFPVLLFHERNRGGTARKSDDTGTRYSGAGAGLLAALPRTGGIGYARAGSGAFAGRPARTRTGDRCDG